MALWLAFLVKALVFITVGEGLLTPTMLKKVNKVASVGGSSRMAVIALAILPTILPSPLVVVSPGRPPHPVPILLTLLPFALKSLPIVPLERARPMPSTPHVLTLKHPVPVLLTTPGLLVIDKIALKYLFLCDRHSLPVPGTTLHLPEVQSILVGQNLEGRLFH